MTEQQVEVIPLSPEKYADLGLGCLRGKKHPGYEPRRQWLLQQQNNGLLLYELMVNHQPTGFIEALPAEHSWRAVDAPGYLVIQCLYVLGKEYHSRGYAGQLIQTCISQARQKGMAGVAALSADCSMTPRRDIFLKYGFRSCDEHAGYELMAYPFSAGTPLPHFTKQPADAYHELTLRYSAQCPMQTKAAIDIAAFCKENDIDIHLSEVTTAEQAHRTPCPLGTFALLYRQQLVCGHPISASRFRNILTKELKLL